MYDFLRVSCAVPELEVAGVALNADRIISLIEKANADGAEVVVFPELAVTGYTCQDLFFQRTLISESNKALEKIVRHTSCIKSCIFVGAPISVCGQLYNCAVAVLRGKIIGIVPKTFLPDYNEYYEKRWFSSSEELDADTVTTRDIGLGDVGDYEIAIGRDLIFDIGTCRVGCEICEDLWTPLPPSTFLALSGAELIVNLSASNETISKREYRRSLVKQQSARCLCAYAYTSAGSGESTSDLVFSGHSLVCENGSLVCENKKLIDNDYILTCDVDLGKVFADRKKMKTFKDSAHLYGKYQRTRTVYVSETVGGSSDGALYPLNKYPFVPSDKNDRLKRCMDIFEMQVAGLKKRLDVTKSKLVVGVSGGLDSTLALLVAAQAMKETGRDLADVVGITMPCFGTSERTHNNSFELMSALGITSKEIPIKDACIQHFNDIGHDGKTLDLTYENCQARERTQVLMDYACKIGGFVVGTGDLSELALGFCTYNGDHMSMYGVNASIPKTLIRWLIDSLIEYNVFDKATDVLRDILDTPISPELLPPDEKGKIAQQTEDIVGPYALHDFFLYYLMRYGYEPEKIYHLALRAFDGEYDAETVQKWLKIFYRRFFTQQFKRNCMPDGVKVGSICLSPRGDFRMPSDANARAWLDRVNKL